MASLRLSLATSLLRNISRAKSARNVPSIVRRENHILCKFSRITPEISALRNGISHRWSYRLEHTAQINNITSVNEAVTEKVTDLRLKETEVVRVPESQSSADVTSANYNFDESMLPPIPSVDSTVETASQSFQSLGLGGWTPSGIMQQILEFLHVTFDLPWWAAIVGLTFMLRIFMFPFMIKMRRDTAHYQNNLPELMELQKKMSQARQSGNFYETAMIGQQLTSFLSQKKMITIGMFVPYLIQCPVFLSVYFALKGMAKVPDFKSFQTGGVLWFTDLSIPDQFYLLPLITSLTLYLSIKCQGEMPSVSHVTQYNIRKILEIGIPSVVFLFTLNFPSALSCYWTITNFFVLGQAYLLNTSKARNYFGIPQIRADYVKIAAEEKKKGVVEGFRESYNNVKLAQEIENRERINAYKFEDIGSKPARRTFKYDPKKMDSMVKALKNK